VGGTGGEGFECRSKLPGASARVRFTGPCQGRTVTWDLHLRTLADYREERAAAGAAVRGSLRAFLEVHPGTGVRPWRALVALDLPHIDLPAVRKTVIMLRNWRRLGPGRHEWGPPVE